MKSPIFLSLWASFVIFFSVTIHGQSNPFEGTFLNSSQTITLQFKTEGSEIHGLFAAQGTSFAMKATQTGQQISGEIYGLEGPVPFTAFLGPNGLTFQSTGYSEEYFKMSEQHMLTGVDLTPFMIDLRKASPDASRPTQPNYDYSYSQHNRSEASESYQTYPSPGAGPNCPYPVYDDPNLLSLIQGSQLVYYTRTSYVSSNTASSITYINFCGSGTFTRNTDGSFMVEGSYGDNAQGASRSRNSGTWKLIEYQGQPAVWMGFYNGETSINPVDRSKLQAGRWRIGNTQFALQRNKVRC